MSYAQREFFGLEKKLWSIDEINIIINKSIFFIIFSGSNPIRVFWRWAIINGDNEGMFFRLTLLVESDNRM